MECRLNDCARVIEEYLAGKLAKIDELEEDVIPYAGEWSRGKRTMLLAWRMMNTASILSHQISLA